MMFYKKIIWIKIIKFPKYDHYFIQFLSWIILKPTVKNLHDITEFYIYYKKLISNINFQICFTHNIYRHYSHTIYISEDMKNIFSLEDKVALITGGGSGIGMGIARQFLAAGARVVITGRNPEKLEVARNELGNNCYAIQNDVTEKQLHFTLIGKIEKEIGRLDILVNNAGMHQKIDSAKVSDDEFQQVIDTNLNSVFALTREILKKMMPRGEGSIINISSMAALYGLPEIAAYSSAKTALLGLTRTLAAEYSHTGIRINAIAPGFIESDMLRKAMERDPERKRKVLGRTPMNRFGNPDEIGYAAVFLASDASRFITGICLPVDGGNSIGF
jgi:NAD(P)-dependent dehydrogenase (short-subunit alcohol dehydrogenase family)